MGVNLFMGRFKGCVNSDRELLNCSVIQHKNDCLANNYTWFNPKINFDNVPNGYLALFQVVGVNQNLVSIFVISDMVQNSLPAYCVFDYTETATN